MEKLDKKGKIQPGLWEGLEKAALVGHKILHFYLSGFNWNTLWPPAQAPTPLFSVATARHVVTSCGNSRI